MFTALENEIVRILRANLSSPDIIPPPVPTDRILSGPLGSSPQQSEFPTVVFSATAFTVVPETECSPPGEVKVGVEETCAANVSVLNEALFALPRPQETRASEALDDLSYVPRHA